MDFGGGWRLLHGGERCLCVKTYSGPEQFWQVLLRLRGGRLVVAIFAAMAATSAAA